MADLSAWSYYREITCAQATAAKTDYQVKVSLTSSNFTFANAKADGTDIRFTASDGTTLLDFWRESYDNGAQTGVFWVKLPNVSNSATITYRIYYGNAAAADVSSIVDMAIFGDDFTEPTTVYGTIDDHPTTTQRIGGIDGIAGNPVAVAGGSGWRQNQVREASNAVWDSVNSRWAVMVSGRDSGGDGSIGLYTASTLEGTWTEHASAPNIAETVVSAGEDGVENLHVWIDTAGDIGDAGDWFGWSEVVNTGKIYAFKSTDQGVTWSILNSGTAVMDVGLDTTLNGGVSASDTTMVVTSATGAYVGDRVWVENEWVRVSNVAGTTLTIEAPGFVNAHVDTTAVKGSDSAFVASPAVTFYSGTLYMIYEGAKDPATGDYIAHANLATSTDGITWTKLGPIINPSETVGTSNRYQIVFDSAKKIGATWYGISHNKGTVDSVTDWRTHLYTTTDEPNAWDRDSWALAGTNPLDDGSFGQKFVDEVGANTADAPAGAYFIMSGFGATEVNVARYVGGSRWVSGYVQSVPDSNDGVQSFDRSVDANDHLLLKNIYNAAAVGDRHNGHLQLASSPALTVDWAIRVRWALTQDHYGALAVGTGAITDSPNTGGGDNTQWTTYSDGYFIDLTDSDASTGNVRILEATSDLVANLTGNGDIASATMKALNTYELRYSDAATGNIALVDSAGTSIVSGTDTTHVATSKNVAIGVGDANDATQPGGILQAEFIFARKYDGEDPAQTVSTSEVAVEVVIEASYDFSAQEVFNRAFDPTANILRLGTTGGAVAAPTQFSLQEILNRVFNPASNILVTSGTGPGGPPARFSAQEILNRVFDPATNTLATSGTGPGGPPAEFSVQEILNRVFNGSIIKTSGTGPGGPPHQYSAQQVLSGAFDSATNSLDNA